MLKASNIEIRFNTRVLFENVNIEFKDDNCYGIIGANGAGKSTFLRILSGELEPTKGDVILGKGERLSVLKQNHNEFDEYTVLDTVIMGDYRLYKVKKEKNDLYMKEDFSMEDGIKVAELEEEFASLNGWQAESDIAVLLSGLGLKNDCLYKNISELKDSEKVKVLLARAIFGNPDVLLLDEPTNGLDSKSIMWLEELLINFKNTVLVVSHDRHFLNKVCTHMVDIDYGKITLFVGNYDFWYESSQLIQRQMKDSNKKKEDKIKELEDFIRRFSANASKSKQATSRKKTLEKIQLDEIKPSTRRYPFIEFKPERVSGKEILEVDNISKEVEGTQMLKNVSFKVLNGDKIVLLGDNSLAKTCLFKILSGELKQDKGKITFGKTIKCSYLPQDNEKYFKSEKSIVEWIADEYNINAETIIRSFLGRMLFSGEESLKKVNVLSGGERARCLLSRCMLENPNLLFLDEPTNHLDLESITALNNGLIRSDAELIFTSHDHQFIQTVENRIIDRRITYDEYLEEKINQKK